ncbi:MAG: hypothetical protein K2N87_08140 [Eubacterium sp.]|nr:hypothetical protein [Eubacterium sp.]
MGRKKKVVQAEKAGRKKVSAVENPESFMGKCPVWGFKMHDASHPRWSIENYSFYEAIMNKLISFEGLTWSEIQAASGGRRIGTNHHFEPIEILSKEAQKRILELKLDIDEVFSFRLSSTERLYGIVEDGVFYILWYDPIHEITPVSKK